MIEVHVFYLHLAVVYQLLLNKEKLIVTRHCISFNVQKHTLVIASISNIRISLSSIILDFNFSQNLNWYAFHIKFIKFKE